MDKGRKDLFLREFYGKIAKTITFWRKEGTPVQIYLGR
jgi:hypothetical protein